MGPCVTYLSDSKSYAYANEIIISAY
jgi:hypothetical protein